MDCNNAELEQMYDSNYFGVALSENGGTEEAVRPRMNAAWMKWNELTKMIYDICMYRKPLSKDAWNSDLSCSTTLCWTMDTQKDEREDVNYYRDENDAADQRDNTTK